MGRGLQISIGQHSDKGRKPVNQDFHGALIPTVLGNLVGGLAFTGLTLYATHVLTKPKRQPAANPSSRAAA